MAETKKLWTLLEIRTKIQQDLDLKEETFINDTEVNDYINEGIDEAEVTIHKLGMQDDYFLKMDNISLVAGTRLYDLPTDIYASMIKQLVYRNGSTVYPIKRLRNVHRFEEIARIEQFNQESDYYQYIMVHTSQLLG
ncbi:unnamed protein product, partial [marine sediment metagenome]